MSDQYYASELTKYFLQKAGVVDVDFDTLTVYGANGPLTYSQNNCGYLIVSIYDLDDNYEKIKIPRIMTYKKKDGTISQYMTYVYKTRTIGLHRLLWAWKYGIVPYGTVIDHKNNHHERLEDYALDNLKPLTQGENLAKERPDSNKKILKPAKNRDINYYQSKLNNYLEKYERAKRNHQAEEVHKLRTNISNQKAKIRYLLKRGNNE